MFRLKATLALPLLKRFVSGYFISRQRGSLSVRNLIRTLATVTSNEPRQVIYTRVLAPGERKREREREIFIRQNTPRVIYKGLNLR